MSLRIPILRIGDTLVTSVQVELRDSVVDAFQRDVLTMLERTGARGVVIDISTLDMVDTYVARMLTETGQMARLMGARTVIVGMRPEVAATLTSMGFSLLGVDTALSLEEGLARLHRPEDERGTG